MGIHVGVQNGDEFGDDAVALEGSHEAAIDVHRRFGFFKGAGKRDADVGVLGFSGPVDHATHDRDLHRLDAGMGFLPPGHLHAEVGLDLVRHLLEEGAGGAAAAGAGGDLRSEAADAERLKNLLADDHLFGTVAIGHRGERSADGVADAFEQQRRERGGGGDDSLAAEAGFGEAEVQRIIAGGGEHAVDVDQVLDAADFGAEDDLVVRHAVALGGTGGVEGARDHGVERDFARVLGFGEAGIIVHHSGEQRAIERAPVDADADGLLVLDGHVDHGAEIVDVLAADVAIAGIDAVLGERAGTVGIFLKKDVAVVMEVANDGHAHAELGAGLDDLGYGGGGGFGVDRDAHQLASGAGERHDLVDGGGDVGGVGIGHRLNDDGVIAADFDAADIGHGGAATRTYCHEASMKWKE